MYTGPSTSDTNTNDCMSEVSYESEGGTTDSCTNNTDPAARGIIDQSETKVLIEYDCKDFDCPVCLDILVNPVTIECSTRSTAYNAKKCECIVCKKCAQKLWETSQNSTNPKCMNCSKSWFGDYQANVFLTNIVDQMKRPCPNKSKGCAFTGTKDELDKHWCLHESTSCPNSNLGCKHVFLRKDVLSHAMECEYFPCRARYGGAGCQKLAKCKNIKHHHSVCDYASSKVLKDTIYNLHVQGKIHKKGKGFAFGCCNEKQWLQKLKFYTQCGLSLEDFHSKEYISDAYKALQVMSLDVSFIM